MKTLKYLLAAFMLLSFGAAFGQYTGTGSIENGKLSTVEQVKNNAAKLDRQDVLVKIKGYVVEQINSEDFWFQDATGKIRIEIDKKKMPAKPFDEKTELIITGEVDADLLESTIIDVKKVEFVVSE
jgi:uncharacterized protein (TIGR00156 family)